MQESISGNGKKHLNEDTYRSIFKNMRSGVAYQKIILGSKNEPIDFIFIEVNKAFEKILGLKRDDIIGKMFSEIMPATKESMFAWATFYGKIALTGKEIKFEQFLKDVGRWYVVSSYSLEKEYFITIYDDITERKNMEDSLRKAYNTLKATQAQLIQTEKMEVVGNLTTGIAHEIRNPLAIVQQSMDYLKKKIRKKDKDILFALSSAENATKRATEIVSSLLAFSRTPSKEITPESPNTVVKNSLILVRHAAERNHVKVITRLGKTIPKVRIDKIRMEQVLINLFMNAIQAMNKGGRLEVTTRSGKDQARQRCVYIVVEDTGPGIPSGVINKIFDPFFTTKKVGEGTGLGLYVVDNIIKAHGANLMIENRTDRTGVCATITFKT